MRGVRFVGGFLGRRSEFEIYDALKGTSFKCLFCAILCVLISQSSVASCSPFKLFHNYGGLNKFIEFNEVPIGTLGTTV